jgi:hypothetical protein
MTVYTSSSRLHPREVMLIRRLLVLGWSDERIWKEYRIPTSTIQKAKKIIERQAMEEFGNKELHAVELAKLKDQLKIIIDSNDSIAKDENVSYADRLRSESIKLEALAFLRDTIEVSISVSDPLSALKKNVELNS